MTYHTQSVQNEPILIVTFGEPLGFDDSARVRDETIKFKKEKGTYVYRILDFSKTQITFDLMTAAMAEERTAEGGVNDPQVSTNFVGTTELVSFGVKAFKEQKQYGQAPVELFTSVDDALKRVRAKIAEKK